MELEELEFTMMQVKRVMASNEWHQRFETPMTAFS